MGTFVAGQHDTPYKMADRGLDLFADNAADNRKLMGNVGGATGATNTGVTQDARVANAIAYISPDLGGLTLAAATVFGAAKANSTANKGSAVSLAALYSNGPIFADFAYQSLTLGDVGTGDLGAPSASPALAQAKDTGIKVGVGFNGGAFAVNAVIERASLTAGSAALITAIGSSAITNTNLYLAGKFNISATDVVKAAFAKQGDMGGTLAAATTGAKQITVGYDHAMSKTTTVYALYTKKTYDLVNTAAPSTMSVGYKHSF
jgi:predicted porin